MKRAGCTFRIELSAALAFALYVGAFAFFSIAHAQTTLQPVAPAAPAAAASAAQGFTGAHWVLLALFVAVLLGVAGVVGWRKWRERHPTAATKVMSGAMAVDALVEKYARAVAKAIGDELREHAIAGKVGTRPDDAEPGVQLGSAAPAGKYGQPGKFKLGEVDVVGDAKVDMPAIQAAVTAAYFGS